MTRNEALEIMHAFLRDAEKTRIRPENAPLAITGMKELADPPGWVFYFNTQKWAETRLFEHAIIGQGPTIVLADGRLLDGGSAESVDMVLRRFGVSKSAPAEFSPRST
ncbi:hypothetical protein CO670_31560 [Rhizobium sp. J15]|uniref:hypothetical protein n=1 Tax=Rhizobium sp. J15 TaxID=2035450 RepID=UPI000BE8E469|nr:hypothetical protein [Rhizobium sp. J15]PDT09645.1 hypothetical protein CO670_31560 [Rhizobium sp. J15]